MPGVGEGTAVGWFEAVHVGSVVDGFGRMRVLVIGSTCAGARSVSVSGIDARAPSGVVGMMTTIAIDVCASG